MKMTIGVLSVALLCLAPSLAAHHGWSYVYDTSKPITVKGVVTKVQWTNPHIHFYVDAKDEKGVVESWNFEMASPLAVERSGGSRRDLPIGAQVTIEGFAGTVTRVRAVASKISLADGRELFAGEPEEPQ